VIRGAAVEITQEEIDRRVEVRIARQVVLTRDDPLRLSVVIDEAALWRQVGSKDIMKAQLAHLLKIARLPRVTIQVISYASGAHPGGTGPFAVLKFSDPADPEAVYVENIAGELFVEEPEEVEPFLIAFQRLVGVALSPTDSIAMIAEMARL